jgi:GNAT superfamily N-acetyltransferase
VPLHVGHGWRIASMPNGTPAYEPMPAHVLQATSPAPRHVSQVADISALRRQPITSDATAPRRQRLSHNGAHGRADESGEDDVTANAVKATLQDINYLRALYLQETNFQIRFDSCHWRGWSDEYLLMLDGVAVGYGSIKGKDDLKGRDTVFEFYVVPPFRTRSRELFTALLASSHATHIECQSNDRILSPLLSECARDINSHVVLFEDHVVTHLEIPGAVARRRREDDKPFDHTHEPLGDFVVEVDREIVATGGFLTHYNPPFADLYMEVREDRRRRGFGTLVLQEAKKACYLAGRIPAARTNINNLASRATLTKAGLRVSGFILIGSVKA